ncbi:hypothetical protein MO867_21795 [Microbulbifer sp. OS29]|uniref:Uncharacterized protein n=1 Tax=Microbulbifer okhotskensis TaxID=2926617 RepID=A0A9X2EXA5_9GAMM|nr:hypothetical protein [Microbulbifer okhotskensis]MCO1336963.1 hypothetical protein [Microbulbifer okhotskensis]
MLGMISDIAIRLAEHRYDLQLSNRITTSDDWHSYLMGSHLPMGYS